MAGDPREDELLVTVPNDEAPHDWTLQGWSGAGPDAEFLSFPLAGRFFGVLALVAELRCRMPGLRVTDLLLA